MFKITHDFPDHPASSFNYPDKSSLPTIASFTFIKEKEYELTEVFDLNNPGNVVSTSEKNGDKFKYTVDNGVEDNTIVTFVPSPAAESTTADYDRSINPELDPDLLSAVKMRPKSGYRSSGSPKDFMKKKYQSRFLKVSLKTKTISKLKSDYDYRIILAVKIQIECKNRRLYFKKILKQFGKHSHSQAYTIYP